MYRKCEAVFIFDFNCNLMTPIRPIQLWQLINEHKIIQSLLKTLSLKVIILLRKTFVCNIYTTHNSNANFVLCSEHQSICQLDYHHSGKRLKISNHQLRWINPLQWVLMIVLLQLKWYYIGYCVSGIVILGIVNKNVYYYRNNV